MMSAHELEVVTACQDWQARVTELEERREVALKELQAAQQAVLQLLGERDGRALAIPDRDVPRGYLLFAALDGYAGPTLRMIPFDLHTPTGDEEPPP